MTVTTATLDQVCAEAVDLAAQAARDGADRPEDVGEHLGVAAAGDRSAVHRFAITHPGYRGWSWAVAVSRVPRARTATVDEVWLEPGDDALLAPAWTPWQERVRPGDLGVGDVHPTAPDEPRLAPGWSGADDPEGDAAPGPLSPLGWVPGLGRARVLSAWGREDAAARWAEGDTGPDSAMAKAAPGRCSSCGWLLTIGGPLGQGFGICAHAMSPSDGRAVTLDHGCGAHSESGAQPATVPVVDTVVDDWGFDDLEIVPRDAAEEPLSEEVVAEEPADEEVVAEEPADEEVVAEEPADEEVVAQEPAAEDSADEDTAGEDAAAR